MRHYSLFLRKFHCDEVMHEECTYVITMMDLNFGKMKIVNQILFGFGDVTCLSMTDFFLEDW